MLGGVSGSMRFQPPIDERDEKREERRVDPICHVDVMLTLTVILISFDHFNGLSYCRD